MRLVLDASAAVNAIVPSTLRAATLDRLEGAEVLAPSLIDTEVLSALARLERQGAISTAEADDAVRAWSRMPCDRIDTTPFLAEVWRLRHGVRIADAHYVALAQHLGSPLLTADARLTRSSVVGLSVLLVA